MYIVAIAWFYVTGLMALTEESVTAGLLTFLFYGALPLALFLWLVGTPARRRSAARRDAVPDQRPGEGDRANAEQDQSHL